ncbi:MAG: uroporphyrinogen-III synthase [Acidobacteriota bacterium]|nr:uroporphyrinogen-III synthase [Acidobacteriota bacterium]
METLIRREGGNPFIAPSVEERALEDHSEALDFIDRLHAGEFDLVVCMTGAGLAFLREIAIASAKVEMLAEGLRNTFIVSRGPKPVPLLREMGARAQIVVPEPNTWKEVVAAVAARKERRIAVQEYGKPNLEMTAALEELGAKVRPFAIYRWDMPPDRAPLREAARRLAGGEIDVVLFTSSIQLDHLFQIAVGLGLEEKVREALTHRTAIASVGPIMSEALEVAGLPVDISPLHPKMAGLVKAASDASAEVLSRKRRLNMC